MIFDIMTVLFVLGLDLVSRLIGRRRDVLYYVSKRKHLPRSVSYLLFTWADQWPDQVRLSDLEPRFVCKACGKRGADVRSDFPWNKPPVAAMGYR